MEDSFYDECPYCDLDSSGSHKLTCPNYPNPKKDYENFYLDETKDIPDDLYKSIEQYLLGKWRKSKMNIQEFTTEELENELVKRKEEKRIRNIPKRMGSWHIDSVVDYIDRILIKISETEKGFEFPDYKWNEERIKIYKKFMMEIYGDKIVTWLDEKGYYL